MMRDPTHAELDEPRKRVDVIAAPLAADGSAIDHESNHAWRPPDRAPLDPGHERVLAALELVFPVCFQLCGADLSKADGIVVLGSAPSTGIPASVPRLVLPLGDQRGGALTRSATHTPGSSEAFTRVALSDDPSLARPLRGRAIPESRAACETPAAPPGCRWLASVADRPVWWQIEDTGSTVDISAYELARLSDHETLREHLRAGRFMGLLPLVHFIERILGADGWKLPPPRASFVIDDPNLHWPSYGFIRYRELVAHASRHGYHLALATVPIDGWLVDPRATSLLAQSPSALSLLIHGNNHLARELGCFDTDAEAVATIAQALRRVATLERRSGMAVDRVMVPPHGACSEPALRAMFKLGMDGACISRPYPWRGNLPAATPLAGWHPAELVAGGTPVLPRYPLASPREDLALRAMLGQPLILYGHHGDCAQGLDILAEAAREINDLGSVRWGRLGSIARENYATRPLGETLLVRMYARRITVEVPAGVRTLRVLLQTPLGGSAGHRLSYGSGSVRVDFKGSWGVSEPLKHNGPGRVELTLMADQPLNPAHIPAPDASLWPWIRRALVEGRDRLQALR